MQTQQQNTAGMPAFSMNDIVRAQKDPAFKAELRSKVEAALPPAAREAMRKKREKKAAERAANGGGGSGVPGVDADKLRFLLEWAPAAHEKLSEQETRLTGLEGSITTMVETTLKVEGHTVATMEKLNSQQREMTTLRGEMRTLQAVQHDLQKLAAQWSETAAALEQTKASLDELRRELGAPKAT